MKWIVMKDPLGDAKFYAGVSGVTMKPIWSDWTTRVFNTRAEAEKVVWEIGGGVAVEIELKFGQ